MAWLLKAEQSEPLPFFFLADDATAVMVAEAVADHYAVSVLVDPKLADKKISGRLVAHSLQEALQAMSFLLNCKFRGDVDGSSWMVGGEAVHVVTQSPSYGLSSAEVAGISHESARLVGDRIILEADQGKTKEIQQVLEAYKIRPSMLLELFLLDVSSTSVDRVNEWLDQFRIGVGYVAQAALVVADPTHGAVAAAATIQKVSGPVYDVQVAGLLRIIEKERNARVELRQQLQVVSGSETTFSSGEIVETQLITREPETGKDLVSKVERRTVGLQLRLRGVDMGDGWFFRVDLDDSNFVSNRERSTKIITERYLKLGTGLTLLASFTRKSDETIRSGVPILGAMGRLGRRLFNKQEKLHGERSLMLLARPVAVL